MTKLISSELEKTNLEVHVEMNRQRYEIISEKVDIIDGRIDAVIVNLEEFRKEHAENMQTIREENALNTKGTHNLFVGAAATIVGGLLSTIVVLLIAVI